MQIQGVDTDGGLNTAKVNSEGQLRVRSVGSTEIEHSVFEGDAFQVYTGLIVLPDAAKRAVLYIKNNDTDDIMITTATVGTGPAATASSNEVLVESVGNTLATDDIVVNGTDALAINRNSGSSRQFAGVVKKGPSLPAASGVAVTGSIGDFTNSQTFSLTSIVPKGGNAALEITPPSGNTGMNVTVSIGFHILEES